MEYEKEVFKKRSNKMYSYHINNDKNFDSNLDNEILSLIDNQCIKMCQTPIDIINGIKYFTIPTELTTKVFTNCSYDNIQDMGITISDYLLTTIVDINFKEVCKRNIPVFKINSKKLSKIVFDNNIKKCLKLSDIFCYKTLAQIMCYVIPSELTKMVNDNNYISKKYTIGIRSRIGVPKEIYDIVQVLQKL